LSQANRLNDGFMEMESLFVRRSEMGSHLEQSAQRGSDDTGELDENMIVAPDE
jgi:hypothetical protein